MVSYAFKYSVWTSFVEMVWLFLESNVLLVTFTDHGTE